MLPDFSEIPSILSTFRRRRAISVGPQSEADAYETLAYREKRRRESLSSGNMASPPPNGESKPTTAPASNRRPSTLLRFRNRSKLDEYENMMGTGSLRFSPSSDREGEVSPSLPPQTSPEKGVEEASEEEVFSRITKPRVRYDVEVVTKLIVYSGMES